MDKLGVKFHAYLGKLGVLLAKTISLSPAATYFVHDNSPRKPYFVHN